MKRFTSGRTADRNKRVALQTYYLITRGFHADACFMLNVMSDYQFALLQEIFVKKSEKKEPED